MQEGDRIELTRDITDGVHLKKGHRGRFLFNRGSKDLPLAVEMDDFGFIVVAEDEIVAVTD